MTWHFCLEQSCFHINWHISHTSGSFPGNLHYLLCITWSNFLSFLFFTVEKSDTCNYNRAYTFGSAKDISFCFCLVMLSESLFVFFYFCQIFKLELFQYLHLINLLSPWLLLASALIFFNLAFLLTTWEFFPIFLVSFCLIFCIIFVWFYTSLHINLFLFKILLILQNIFFLFLIVCTLNHWVHPCRWCHGVMVHGIFK